MTPSNRHRGRRAATARAAFFLAVLAVVLALPIAVSATEPTELAGHWEGAILLPGDQELAVMVDLAFGDPEGWSGTIDIPMQGAEGLALTGFEVDGDAFRFSIEGVPGNPTFDGRLADGEIRGDFRQGAAELTFRLGREEVELPARPQEPQAPFPYEVEEVTYKNGEIELAGTLTLPPGDGPFPAAVLITGSGAQDRDESLLGHKPFLILADHLTRSGIAVLRADDRGVGGSTGSVLEATSVDFAEDALAGLALLAAHPKVAADRIGLIGHSEGGVVAPIAASRSDDVAYLVLLAGTGVPLTEVILRQSELIARAGGADEEAVEKALARSRAGLALVSSTDDEDTVAAGIRKLAEAEARETLGEEADAAAIEATVEQELRVMLSPWMRFLATYDPRSALSWMTVPVLALNGELDLQVEPAQNLPEIVKALGEAGNLDVTARALPGLNHLFQSATTGHPSEYAAIEETMSPVVLELVSDWIRERFAEDDDR